MSQLLLNLCSVDQVRGAALYTEGWQCVEHRLPPPYEPGYIRTVAQELVSAFEFYTFLESSPAATAMARASDGLVAMMSTKGFHAFLIAEPDVNLTFIKVAFSALEHRLTQAGSIGDLDQAAIPLVVGQGEMAPLETLRGIVEAYTEFAGPAARLLIKAEIRHLGFHADTFPLSRIDALIGRAASRLLTPEDRAAFEKDAARWMPKPYVNA